MYTQVLVMKTQILPLENHDVDQGSGPRMSGPEPWSTSRANYPVWRVNVTPRQRERSLPLREATWSTNVRRRWHTCQQVVSHTRSNNKVDLAQATKVLVPLAIAVIHTIQDPSTVKVQYTKPEPKPRNPTTTPDQEVASPNSVEVMILG